MLSSTIPYLLFHCSKGGLRNSFRKAKWSCDVNSSLNLSLLSRCWQDLKVVDNYLNPAMHYSAGDTGYAKPSIKLKIISRIAQVSSSFSKLETVVHSFDVHFSFFLRNLDVNRKWMQAFRSRCLQKNLCISYFCNHCWVVPSRGAITRLFRINHTDLILGMTINSIR